jgi:hypothetical protein
VIIIVSLSPLATNVGGVIAAKRLSFDGSGIPKGMIAVSCASRVARSVGSLRSACRAKIRSTCSIPLARLSFEPHIMGKLKLETRAELVMFPLANGVIGPNAD